MSPHLDFALERTFRSTGLCDPLDKFLIANGFHVGLRQRSNSTDDDHSEGKKLHNSLNLAQCCRKYSKFSCQLFKSFPGNFHENSSLSPFLVNAKDKD